MEFDYDELVRATRGFSSSSLIGKGSHGFVYRGLLEDDKVVAIKASSSSSSSSCVNTEKLKKLENEICVLSSLRENPYIVKFVGTSRDSVGSKTKLLVMEFMPNGSLHEWLHLAAYPPTWAKRVEIALHVARAVRSLHLRDDDDDGAIIHRDIKSQNVLFDSGWNAKLADFGLAVSRADQPSPPAGTMGYLDPSYTSPSKLSTKIDVFSFGVLLLEIMSCRQAIDLSRSPSSIVDWAIPLIQNRKTREICSSSGGGRTAAFPPPNMAALIKRVLNLAAGCVEAEEESRPSFRQIVAELESCSINPVRNNLPVWICDLRSMVLQTRRRKRSKRFGETIAEKPVEKTTWLRDVLSERITVSRADGVR